MAAPTTNTELHRVLGRMEGKMDGISAIITALHTEHKEQAVRIRDTENTVTLLAGLHVEHDVLRMRMAALEKRQYQWTGAAAIASPVILTVFAVVARSLSLV